MNSLVSSAYWPNIQYFVYVLHSEHVRIELYEHYQKQSFRNRCQILSANGKLDLSIPVKHLAKKELTKDVEISYQENWQAKHWRAIVSAYKNSPYFEHFEMEMELIYKERPKLLVEFNNMQLELILKLLRVKKEFNYTLEFEHQPLNCIDLRERIHPKIDFSTDSFCSDMLSKPYYQTFSDKMAFEPNLSILDLLFNKGLDTLSYLNFSNTN